MLNVLKWVLLVKKDGKEVKGNKQQQAAFFDGSIDNKRGQDNCTLPTMILCF